MEDIKSVIKIECAWCGGDKDDDDIIEHEGENCCIQCYHEHFEFTCIICEEYCEDPTKAEDTFFYLHEDNGNLKPGYYSVLEYPIWSSDMFSVNIWEFNVKHESKNVCYKTDGPLDQTDYICKECFDKKGVDLFHVEKHIQHELDKEYRKIGSPKEWSRVTIEVSTEYYDTIGGKYKSEKVEVVRRQDFKTQQMFVSIEL